MPTMPEEAFTHLNKTLRWERQKAYDTSKGTVCDSAQLCSQFCLLWSWSTFSFLLKQNSKNLAFFTVFSPDPSRGLSLGGRFLTCDCRMRWVSEWIRRHDLQVTSREREPKFCGHPQRLRDRSFYQLEPEGKIHSFFWDGISQKKMARGWPLARVLHSFKELPNREMCLIRPFLTSCRRWDDACKYLGVVHDQNCSEKSAFSSSK